MRQASLIAILTVGAFGCANTDAYVEVYREQLGAYEELVRILAGITDATSMEGAEDKLAALNQRSAAIVRRARALPKNPGNEVRRQIEPEMERMERVISQLQREMRRIQAMPRGPEFLQTIDFLKRAEP